MKINSFLNTLTDKEIAYFYTYRFSQYSKETQVELKEYIFEKRKLTTNQILNLINEKKVSIKNACNRCGSIKSFHYEVDYDSIDLKYLSRYGKKEDWNEGMSLDFIKTSQKECLVCGQKFKSYKKTKRILFIVIAIIIAVIVRSVFH